MKLPSFFDVPLGELATMDMKEVRRVYDVVLPKMRDEAAAQMKRKYDKGREEVIYEKGDLVWLRRQERSKVEPRKDGPFRVKERKSPLTYVLEDVAESPAKLGLRSPIQNVKHLEKYEQKMPVEEEFKVKEILGHKKGGTKRKFYKYHVKWADGDETWERVPSLIDEEGDEEVILDALKRYWKAHPGMQEEEGY